MGWKLSYVEKQTIETFDSYGRLIPDFQDGKRNRLHDAYLVFSTR
jgi:hypothetical protein